MYLIKKETFFPGSFYERPGGVRVASESCGNALLWRVEAQRERQHVEGSPRARLVAIVVHELAGKIVAREGADQDKVVLYCDRCHQLGVGAVHRDPPAVSRRARESAILPLSFECEHCADGFQPFFRAKYQRTTWCGQTNLVNKKVFTRLGCIRFSQNMIG